MLESSKWLGNANAYDFWHGVCLTQMFSTKLSKAVQYLTSTNQLKAPKGKNTHTHLERHNKCEGNKLNRVPPISLW